MNEVLKAFDLTDRVVLVTGASSYGIGSASAKLMADVGAKVFLVARREEALKERAAEIEAAGGKAAWCACDVSSEEGCKAAVEKCVETFGRLDVMVLSAGMSGKSNRSYDDDFDSENWRTMQDVNLDGTFWMMKYGHAECAKGGVGSIIVVSSLGAYTGSGSAAYTATKGALRSMTTHFGKTLAAENVRINTIYPGFIDTDMTHAAFGNEDYAPVFLREVPLGRFGKPEDIAYTALYLASDAASWVTGQHFLIDGGQMCS